VVFIKKKVIKLYLERYGCVPSKDNLNNEGINKTDLATVVVNSEEAKLLIEQLTSVD
jgi:hypothetical protein